MPKLRASTASIRQAAGSKWVFCVGIRPPAGGGELVLNHHIPINLIAIPSQILGGLSDRFLQRQPA